MWPRSGLTSKRSYRRITRWRRYLTILSVVWCTTVWTALRLWAPIRRHWISWDMRLWRRWQPTGLIWCHLRSWRKTGTDCWRRSRAWRKRETASVWNTVCAAKTVRSGMWWAMLSWCGRRRSCDTSVSFWIVLPESCRRKRMKDARRRLCRHWV